MGIKVEGYTISDYEISQEKKRLEPYFAQVFGEKKGKNSENRLTDWAVENLVERTLIFLKFREGKDADPEHFLKKFISEDELEIFVDELKANARIDFYEEEKRHYPKKLHSLLIKPAGPDCNMECDYCFYLNKKDLFRGLKHRMSRETLIELIYQSSLQGEPVIYSGWQGGEPTLMGLDFFRRAVELQDFFGNGIKFINAIQTNGLLLDERWAEFFKRNDFLVGISLDGPHHIHDRYRKTAGGKETFRTVERNTRMLLDYGVKVNILATVNDYSVNYPEEIYEFFREMGIKYIQFIPIVERIPADAGKYAAFSVKPRDFGEFLIRTFNLWTKDLEKGNPVSIRYFDSLILKLLGKIPADCELEEECGTYLVVEHDGSVYSCDFYVDKQHFLGNIHTGKLIQFLNSENQINFGRKKSLLPEKCLKCPWLNLCRGGCPKNRLDPHNPSTENYLCEGYRMFFEHSHNKFREILEESEG